MVGFWVSEFLVKGLGFRVYGFRLGFEVLGFRVEDSGFKRVEDVDLGDQLRSDHLLPAWKACFRLNV